MWWNGGGGGTGDGMVAILFVGAKDSKDYEIDRPAKTGCRPYILDSRVLTVQC